MKLGMSPQEACNTAMEEVHLMVEDAMLSCIAFDHKGRVAAASTSREPPLFYMDVEMGDVETRKGEWVRK